MENCSPDLACCQGISTAAELHIFPEQREPSSANMLPAELALSGAHVGYAVPWGEPGERSWSLNSAIAPHSLAMCCSLISPEPAVLVRG